MTNRTITAFVIVLAILAFLASWQAPKSTQGTGRYAITVWDQASVLLLDTDTGDSWCWVVAEGVKPGFQPVDRAPIR